MNNEPFVKFYTNITKSNKLNWNDKIIISEIISWQQENKKCFVGNQALSEKYGITKDVIKHSIKKLNKFNWFESKETSSYNENGIWVNSKLMTIDLDLFLKWLEIPTTQEEPKVSENNNNNVNASISDTQTEETYPTINKEEIVEISKDVEMISSIDELINKQTKKLSKYLVD